MPDGDSVSLELGPHFNTCDSFSFLKLVADHGEKEVFPKTVGVAFLEPDVPSASSFVSIILPQRFDAFLEKVIASLWSDLIWTSQVLVDSPEILDLAM